jgi:hypothetical protein
VHKKRAIGSMSSHSAFTRRGTEGEIGRTDRQGGIVPGIRDFLQKVPRKRAAGACHCTRRKQKEAQDPGAVSRDGASAVDLKDECFVGQMQCQARDKKQPIWHGGNTRRGGGGPTLAPASTQGRSGAEP